MDESPTRSIDWGAVVGAIPGGVAVAADGRYVHVTTEFAEAVGSRADALVGERWERPFAERARGRLDREAIPRARGGDRWRGTVAVRSEERDGFGPDGSVGTDRRVGLTVSATERGSLVWVASSDRADERGARDEDVRRELDRYETIVETVDDGVYALNEDLEFTYVNDGLCDIVGESREELLGTPSTSFIEYDDEVAMARETRRRVVEGDTSWGTVRATVDTPAGRKVVESRYRLYPEPDGEFRGSIGIIREVTERERRQRALQRQRDSLATLDQVNELLLETVRELVQTASREAVERTVCDRLAASDLYRLAWVGQRSFDGDRIEPRVVAGDGGGYLDEVTVTADEHGDGAAPAARALRTGEVQVVRVDDASAPWATAARERGFASVAAVPLRQDETVYGVLAVYTDREAAFHERERAGLDVLGRTVGTVIHAARSRDLLFADAVVELEFDLTGADAPLVATAREVGCEFSLEGYVAAGERWLVYLSMVGRDPETAVETIAASEGAESARVLAHTEDGARIEVAVASSSLLHAVTGAGANLRTAVAGPEEARTVVEAPASVDVRAIVEEVRRTWDGASLVAHRERDRPASSVGRPEDLLSSLTDRQRETLEAAYRAGYFDWPRESTAEEVAETLDLSGPTLHGHLRKAQAQILSALIDGE